MTERAPARRDAARLAREEAALARRAAAGDRAAFDVLFDRYFARMAWLYRELPPAQGRAAIWQALEQLFAGLDSGEELAGRAYRIAARR